MRVIYESPRNLRQGVAEWGVEKFPQYLKAFSIKLLACSTICTHAKNPYFVVNGRLSSLFRHPNIVAKRPISFSDESIFLSITRSNVKFCSKNFAFTFPAATALLLWLSPYSRRTGRKVSCNVHKMFAAGKRFAFITFFSSPFSYSFNSLESSKRIQEK